MNTSVVGVTEVEVVVGGTDEGGTEDGGTDEGGTEDGGTDDAGTDGPGVEGDVEAVVGFSGDVPGGPGT